MMRARWDDDDATTGPRVPIPWPTPSGSSRFTLRILMDIDGLLALSPCPSSEVYWRHYHNARRSTFCPFVMKSQACARELSEERAREARGNPTG
jgi:hypothetical protein